MTQAITKPGLIERIFSPRAETSTLSNPARWLIDAITGGESRAGVCVNPKTAMGLSPYFACLRNISEDIAKTPRHTMRRVNEGAEKASDHVTFRMVHISPNEEMGAFAFHETITQHALGWGGGFAEIVRRGDGRPFAMYALDPTTVTMERSNTGQVRYIVRVAGLDPVPLASQNVIHIKAMGYDGFSGYLMSKISQEVIGAGIATQNYRSRWHGNGAQPSGALEIPAGFQDKQMKNLRESFAERHEGEENKGRTMLLEHGVTWKSISVDAQKAQMIETMEFDVEQICRVFRCMPDYVGHFKRAQGWSSREQTAADIVYNTLMSWYMRWEEEYERKLFLPSERDYFVKFNTDAILRADTEARAAWHTSMFQIGVSTQNDILRSEDKNTIGPSGDVRYVNQTMIPTDLLIEKLKADIEATKNPPEPPAPAAPEPAKPALKEPENRLSTLMMLADAHEPLLADAFARVLRVEATKVEQARKKGNVESLRESFYADHEQHVIAAIGPVIEAFWVAATGKSAQMDYIRAAASCHVTASLHGIEDSALVASWADGERARRYTKALMSEMVELIAGTQTALGGAAK